MSSPGSLIQLHHHDNHELLEQLKDTDGILYYKDAPVFPGVSKKEGNGIRLEADGLFMSNLTMLNSTQYNLVSRFSYQNGALLFDGIIVSQEYTELQIRVMMDNLWDELRETEIIPDTNGIEGGGSSTGGTSGGNTNIDGGTINTGNYITQDIMESYVQQAMTELITSAITDEEGGDSSDTGES